MEEQEVGGTLNNVTQNTDNTEIVKESDNTVEVQTEPSLSDLANVVETINAAEASEVTTRRVIPLTQPVDTGVAMSFEDALKMEFIEKDAVYEMVDSKGRRSFTAIEDVKREVKAYPSLDGNPFILPLSVQGGGDSEGGSIGAFSIERHTKFRFHGFNHKDQVTLLLTNGKRLIGYVVKGFNKEGKLSKRTFYFPRNLAKEVIQMPAAGKAINLKVVKILVG